jgi:hypothetical protein
MLLKGLLALGVARKSSRRYDQLGEMLHVAPDYSRFCFFIILDLHM